MNCDRTNTPCPLYPGNDCSKCGVLPLREPPTSGKSGPAVGYNGTVGPELHCKLGKELLEKANGIEKYVDSLIAQQKNGDPLGEHCLLTITTMAFDLGQHIKWHLEHKTL